MKLTNALYSTPGAVTPQASGLVPTAKATDVAVNVAFFQEIKEDNVPLKQLLQDVQASLDGRWLFQARVSQFRELLGQLRDQLASQFDLEEAYAYFNGPVRVEPELSRQAALLRDEHEALYVQLCDIVEQAQRVTDDEAAPHSRFRHVIDCTRAFVDQFQRHEYYENDLMVRAYESNTTAGS